MYDNWSKNSSGQFVILFIFCVYSPSLFFDNYIIALQERNSEDVLLISLLASTLIAYAILVNLEQFNRYVKGNFLHYIIATWLFWTSGIWLIIECFGWEYSVKYFVWSIGLQLVYFLSFNFFVSQRRQLFFAYIPVGRLTNNIQEQIPQLNWIKLDKPVLTQAVDAIVTDLSQINSLSNEYKDLIAEKILQNVPVYHYWQIHESLTGRVKIDHLHENGLGSLLPSQNYIVMKSVIDILLVILSLPITLIVGLFVAIAIKIDDGGSIFYSQPRIGYRGKVIKVYKFRSMCVNSEEQGAKMASTNDMRITRVGKFIRKTRIDELPQFINVLKGEMSLIGPRPEQKVFVEQFKKTIPFYNYRHVVKPGITGWAQVTQGYASDEDETKIKLEYDLFYIKNFSFFLDLLIFFKTIRTMLTGFGAR